MLVLWLHVLAELSAGLILLVAPQVFEPQAAFNQLEPMRGFGNGAVSVALVGMVLLWRAHRETRRIDTSSGITSDGTVDSALYGIIAQYHCGIAALQCRNPMKGVPVWLAPMFHGILALEFIRCAFQHRGARTAGSGKAHSHSKVG